MLGVADYGAFVVAILLFLLIPGPGNLALITSTGQGGVRAGMVTGLGVIAADQVLMWLAVAGVSALLAAHPTLFHAVQYLGVAYLGWLGFATYLTVAVSHLNDWNLADKEKPKDLKEGETKYENEDPKAR